FDLFLERPHPLVQVAGALFHRRLFGGGSDIDLGGLRCGEESLESVVVGLGNGIELVVVTTSAGDGEAEKGSSYRCGHLGQDFLAVDFGIGVAANQVDLTTATHTGGNQQLGVGPVIVFC